MTPVPNIASIESSATLSGVDWVGIAGLAPALFAILLSVGLGWLEIRRYRLPLRSAVRETEYLGQRKEQYYAVTVRVVFVNPASQGRTVYQLELIQDPEVHPTVHLLAP